MNFLLPAAALMGLFLPGSQAQQPDSHTLENGVVSLTLSPSGGVFKRFVLLADQERTNPISLAHGHFICLDAFGPVSDQEKAAGLKMHGEARYERWQLRARRTAGNTETLEFAVRLPLARQDLVRTLQLAAGEQVVRVSSTIENLDPFDRPIMWQEHVTIGSPFLRAGETVIDMPATQAMTRPFRIGSGPPGGVGSAGPRFRPGEAFQWPWAPGAGGDRIDLRSTPDIKGSISITTQRMRPEGLAFVTALNMRKHLLIGYVFRPSEFPWVQNWESYGENGTLDRGLEFGISPFGMPRQEAVKMANLFGAPTYAWLPAKGRIAASFLMFMAQAPEGMRGVDEIQWENGELLIRDRTTGKEVRLKASLGL